MCDVFWGGPKMSDNVWQREGDQNWSKIAYRTLWTAPHYSFLSPASGIQCMTFLALLFVSSRNHNVYLILRFFVIFSIKPCLFFSNDIITRDEMQGIRLAISVCLLNRSFLSAKPSVSVFPAIRVCLSNHTFFLPNHSFLSAKPFVSVHQAIRFCLQAIHCTLVVSM